MELKGNLKNFALPDIVQLIGTTSRSGVLVITAGPDKASIYFADGRIVHAEHRNLRGQEAVNRIFREKDGGFQFLSGVDAPERTMSLDWMNTLMEAARLNDEGEREGGDDEFDIDFEAAMSEPGSPTPEAVQVREEEVWDPAPVKERMTQLLEENFGKKARKIMKELKGDAGTKLSLLEFCDKAEKYIYVFIDNKRAEEVGTRLRAIIEESL
ncbi:DUF4388 domain-containing protein [Candidatus Moduliflexota bacterium]